MSYSHRYFLGATELKRAKAAAFLLILYDGSSHFFQRVSPANSLLRRLDIWSESFFRYIKGLLILLLIGCHREPKKMDALPSVIYSIPCIGERFQSIEFSLSFPFHRFEYMQIVSKVRDLKDKSSLQNSTSLPAFVSIFQ